MDHEILLHDLLQLNVLHILSLNSVLRNNSAEKKYPTNLMSAYMINIYTKGSIMDEIETLG